MQSQQQAHDREDDRVTRLADPAERDVSDGETRETR
jgi:hypothetical protein